MVSAVTPSISMASNGSTVVSALAAASSSLNGKFSGTLLAELLEHPDVALDDQAGVLLVEVVVAVVGMSLRLSSRWQGLP